MEPEPKDEPAWMKYESGAAWIAFEHGIHNEFTLKVYRQRLAYFFDRTKLDPDEFVRHAVEDELWAEKVIVEYIAGLEARVKARELAGISVTNYITPIRKFCVMNRLKKRIEWDLVANSMPKATKRGNDRTPRLDEIQAILRVPGYRGRAAFLIMVSSGIRKGAFSYVLDGREEPMRVKDIERLPPEGDVKAAKLTVYRGAPEEYYSFITPEAFKAFEDYLADRRKHGEKITPESPVLRNNYHGATRMGNLSAANPKPLRIEGVHDMIFDAEKRAGVRTKTPDSRNYEFRGAHGFRKWFMTQAGAAYVQPGYLEMLMGHTVGLPGHYIRPTEYNVMQEYLKAVPSLTVTPEFKAQQQIDKAEKLERDIEQKDKVRDSELDGMKAELKDTKESLLGMHTILTNAVEDFKREAEAIARLDKLIATTGPVTLPDDSASLKLVRQMEEVLRKTGEDKGTPQSKSRKPARPSPSPRV